ncbi:MAG TPA: dTMP kinase [bacterium]|nr:dTMP kinase [bacterium]
MFIAVEGIDGSGKSTTIAELEKFLTARGHAVHRTAEPTKLDTGRAIRELLGQKNERPYTRHELALLFAADRLRHLEEEVEPALAAGKTVLTDRYLFSSLAYQSVDLPYEWVAGLNRFARLPDTVLYIEVSVDTALSRLARFRQGTEIFETRAFLEKLRANYEKVFKKYTGKVNIVRLDGEVAMSDIAADIEKRLSGIFPKKV